MCPVAQTVLIVTQRLFLHMVATMNEDKKQAELLARRTELVDRKLKEISEYCERDVQVLIDIIKKLKELQ